MRRWSSTSPLTASVPPLLATSVIALVLQLTILDVQVLSDEVPTRARARGAAMVLGALAVALGGMWAYFAVHNAVTGDVPAGSRLVEPDIVVHLGMALDLLLLVPLYGTAAVSRCTSSAPFCCSARPGPAPPALRSPTMTRIEGRTTFTRTPEDVFDFLADPRNEPSYNPLIVSAHKDDTRPGRSARSPAHGPQEVPLGPGGAPNCSFVVFVGVDGLDDSKAGSGPR
jgi:hypothetical protein